MDSISCKRFRRFENLEPLNFKGVNFFVGANNSGKSTVVKAILLLMDNLKNDPFRLDPEKELPLFYLTSQYAHIGDFNRAFHQPKAKDDDENTIELCWHDHRCSFRVVLTNSSIDNMYACYQSIEIAQSKPKATVLVDFVKKTFSYTMGNVEDKYADFDYDKFNELLNKYRVCAVSIDTVEEELWKLKNEDDSQSENPEQKQIDKLESQLDRKASTSEGLRDSLYEMMTKIVNTEKTIYLQRQFNICMNPEKRKNNEIPFAETFGNIFHAIDRTICEDSFSMEDVMRKGDTAVRRRFNINPLLHIRRSVNSVRFEYIYAHHVHQNSVFSILDKNDHIAYAMNEYYKTFASRNKKAKDFINVWLRKFEIGTSIDIKAISGGEMYTAAIHTMSGMVIPLQDLGMGSIQIVVLLLRLAVIIYTSNKELVMIEEPEQNIHPNLQAALADLFLYVHAKHEIKIIVETHSEYMIRRTQYLMAEGGFEINGEKIEVTPDDNPFQVYYFPKEGQPYPMVYQESGLFENKFGEGFFDESGNLLLPVINKARSLQ